MKTIPFSRSISSVSTVKPMFRSFRFSRDRRRVIGLRRSRSSDIWEKKKAGFALLSGAR
jgi:hypothetical protein